MGGGGLGFQIGRHPPYFHPSSGTQYIDKTTDPCHSWWISSAACPFLEVLKEVNQKFSACFSGWHLIWVLFSPLANSLTKLSNCSWPTSHSWWRATTAPDGIISCQVLAEHDSPFQMDCWSLLSNGPSSVHLLRKQSECLLTCMVPPVFSLFSGLVSRWNCSISLETLSTSTIHHHRALGWSIRPTPPLSHDNIVQPVGLIDKTGKKWPLLFLTNEVLNLKFLGDFRVCHQQFHYILQMHRNPVPVVMRPHNKFSQNIYKYCKWCLAQRAHSHQNHFQHLLTSQTGGSIEL